MQLWAPIWTGVIAMAALAGCAATPELPPRLEAAYNCIALAGPAGMGPYLDRRFGKEPPTPGLSIARTDAEWQLLWHRLYYEIPSRTPLPPPLPDGVAAVAVAAYAGPTSSQHLRAVADDGRTVTLAIQGEVRTFGNWVTADGVRLDILVLFYPAGADRQFVIERLPRLSREVDSLDAYNRGDPSPCVRPPRR